MRLKPPALGHKSIHGVLLISQYILIFAVLTPSIDGVVFLYALLSILSIAMRVRFRLHPKTSLLDIMCILAIGFIDPNVLYFLLPTLYYVASKNYSVYAAVPYLYFLLRNQLSPYGIYGAISIGLGLVMSFWIQDALYNQKRFDEGRKREYDLLHFQEQLLDENLHVEKIARLSERQRIAERLHDDLGHELTAALLSLKAYSKLKDKDEEKANERLNQTHEKLESSMTRLKETVSSIEPMTQEHSDTYKKLITTFIYPIDSRMEGDLTLISPRIWHVLESITKEALTNISKHAKPTRISLRLDINAYAVRVSIANDGSIKKTVSDGHGLHFMRRRIEALKGTLSIQNAEEFKLTIYLPLNKGDDL